MTALEALLVQHGAADVFAREHDVILIAQPFSLLSQPAVLMPVHLALANLLERGALFNVDSIGRVVCREKETSLH